MFLGKSLSPVPLSTLEYKWVQGTVEETQQNTEEVIHVGLASHPGRGAILLVASYIGEWMTSGRKHLCKFIDSRKYDPSVQHVTIYPLSPLNAYISCIRLVC